MLTHKGTVKLKTPRLVLRRFKVSDAQAMYENWATDERTTKYLMWETHPSVGFTRELIEKWVSEYENPNCYHWVIEYGGTIVGTVNLHDIRDRAERLELGYSMGSKWWSMGIMTEAVGAVIKFAFTKLNANKICAAHNTANVGSGRVMQKNGMKLEGLLREHGVQRDGTRSDSAQYGLLRSEWVG